jgi:hypothetical protein
MKILFLIITAFLLFSCSSAPPPKTFSVDLTALRYEAGEIEANLDRYLSIGSLKKSPVNVYYYPAEDAVCLQFKVQFVSCNQFWDKTGRDAFVSALRLYQEDFEQRKLVNGNRKTRDAYGTVQGFFAWKRTPVAVQAKGNPKISLGYQFKDKSVFFTTTQGESRYEDPISRERSQTSPVLLMYFTRAQAASLAELFSQENLQGLGKPATGKGGSVVELDEY